MAKPTRNTPQDASEAPKNKKRYITIAVTIFFILFLIASCSDTSTPSSKTSTSSKENTPIDTPIDTPSIPPSDIAEKIIAHKIAYRDVALSTENIYVAIEPLTQQNPEYKKQIKNLIKYIAEKENTNIAITVMDDVDFLNKYYQHAIAPEEFDIPMENSLKFVSDAITLEQRALHTIALYSGAVEFEPYEISFYPAATKDHPKVGHLVENEKFDPKNYHYNFQ